jgi:co-chaperonin GroES (HSP10)
MAGMAMVHDMDPKKAIHKEIGDLSKVEIFNNQVLVAVYQRPEKTSGGIFLPDSTRGEDKYQGKVGLVLKKGPLAFSDPENKWFGGTNIAVNEWIYFRPSDGWAITVNTVLCRVLDDTLIKGRIDTPDRVW